MRIPEPKTWFETKIQYDKTQEDGTMKKTTELYTVDSLSFTEAESRIIEEMSSYISGEFSVKSISKAAYKEIFFSDKATDDYWFKVRLQFIMLDEKTEKEKRTTVTYLVQAHSIAQAITYTNEVMSNTMSDYEIIGIQKSSIFDVFEHNPAAKDKGTAPADAKPEYEAE